MPLAKTLHNSASFNKGEFCGQACLYQSNKYQWQPCTQSNLTFGDCIWLNPDHAGTVALCVHQFCQNSKAAWLEATSTFRSTNAPVYAPTLANATQYARPIPQSSGILHYPVLIEADAFTMAWHTLASFDHNLREIPTIHCAGTAVLACAALGLASLRFFRLKTASKPKHASPSLARRLSVYAKQHLLLPACFSSHARRPSIFGFTFSIPTRLQTILIVALAFINMVSCTVDLQVFLPNIFFTTKTDQVLRYIADRTGIFAVYNAFLMMVFSGRNNILMTLTGSSFNTFNVFHKWFGRFSVVQAIVHSILYLAIVWRRGGWAHTVQVFGRPYLLWGTLATLAGTIVLVQAVHVLRKLGYEVFLVTHIVLALAFFIGTWYHIYFLNYRPRLEPLSYLTWVLSACLIWIVDRIWRILIILWNNVRLTQGRIEVTRGVITNLADDLYQIDLLLARDWDFRPGQYCFLHFGCGLKFLQSHPFTIASYEKQSILKHTEVDDMEGERQETIQKTMRFLVRLHRGLTAALPSLAVRGPSVMLVEGPYGSSLRLSRYENITFLAGGIGIAALTAHVQGAIKEQHGQLHLVWAARTSTEVEVLMPHLSNLADPHVKLSIFVTGTKEEVQVDGKPEGFSEFLVSHGRPGILEVLREDCHVFGSMACVACGPPTFMDECRSACVELISYKAELLDFYSESFEW